MLGPGLELLIVVVLIVFNGLLALSEMALVSARKVRLQQRADAGDAGAAAALAVANDPTRFLSTVQIGITMVGILAGAFGGATLAATLAARLRAAGVGEGTSETLAVVGVVLLITYLSLIVGELVPKRLALQNPERVAARVARPMRLLSAIARPAVALLTASTELVLRVLGVRPVAETPTSEEEITILLQQSTAAGVFSPAEQAMVSNVFRLGDRRVGELMTPRPRMHWLDLTDPIAVSCQEMTESHHTLFPVAEGEVDHVVGVVAIKDVWAQTVEGHDPDLRAAMRPALFLPETMPVLRALELFKQAGTHLAVVVDEFGGTSGLLTLTDVLEDIVGEVPTAGEPADQGAVRREDGSWLLDGLLAVDDMKAHLQLRELPEEDEYQTVGGFVMSRIGRIPVVADAFVWDGQRFEVVDMDGHRVDKVLVSPATGDGATAPSTPPAE